MKPDDELDALFLVHVCGGAILERDPDMTNHPKPTGRWLDGRLYVASWSRAAPNLKMWHDWEKSQFTRSMDAVLPWLEKCGWRGTSNRAGSTCMATVSVVIPDATHEPFEVVAQQDWTHTQTPLPRACVIALLRAHGVSAD